MDALNAIAEIYYYSQGVTQDYAKALKYYQQAAEQGHASAMHNLAVMYKNGEGVEKDLKKSSEYLKASKEAKRNELNENDSNDSTPFPWIIILAIGLFVCWKLFDRKNKKE